MLKFGSRESISTIFYQWMSWDDTSVFVGFCDQGIVCIGFAPSPNDDVLKSFQGQFSQAQFVLSQKTTDELCTMDFYLPGTPFQQKVWQTLFQTKPAALETYTSLAIHCKMPTAVRAVASAVAKNPLAYVVPCHRIIRRDGNLGGFRWTPNMKTHLLNFEQDAHNDNKTLTQADAAKLFLRSLR